MSAATLFALLLFSLADPTGDAIGDGTLTPPTAPLYANAALFDLQSVELEVDDETGAAVLRVAMGALSATAPASAEAGPTDGVPDAAEPLEGADPAAGELAEDALTGDEAAAEAARAAELESFDLANLLAIVDVYLDAAPGGAGQTLAGPDMLMPLGAGWNHAVRITAEGAFGVTYVSEGDGADPEGAAAPVTVPDPAVDVTPSDGEPADPTPAEDGAASEAPADGSGSAPATENLVYVPLTVSRSGNELVLSLPWRFESESEVDLYAMSGVYDPFSPDGWRGIAAQPSPWAFSGGEQVTPVIDLVALDAETQTDALRRGVLVEPPRDPGMSLPLSPWLWLMVGGVALALLGLVLRGRVGSPAGADMELSVSEAATDELPADEDDTDMTDALIGETLELPAVEPEPVEADGDVAPDAPDEVTDAPLEEPSEPDEVPAAESAPEPEDPTADEPLVLPDEEPTEPDRTVLDTQAEDSFLFGDEAAFGDAAETEDESFWHPRSRNKTLTGLEPGAPGERDGE